MPNIQGHESLTDFAFQGPSATKAHWDPLQLQDLLDGLNHRDPVINVQGEVYKIRYIDADRFWYKHMKNRVPCGYSSIRRLQLNMDMM